MFDVKTILVPVDFHDASVAALGAARAIAEKFGAKIIALHVVSPPAVASVAGLPVPPDVEKRNRSSAATELDQLVEIVKGDGEIECMVIQGDVESLIVKTAAESQGDLIIMGTAGRGGIG